MNHTRIEQYVLHLMAVLERFDQVRGKVMQLQADRSYAQQLQPERVSELSQGLAAATQTIERMVGVVTQVAQRATLESARELLVDLQVGLESARAYHVEWRRAKQRFEVDCTLGRYATAPEERATAEAALARLRETYDTQLELLGRLVPSAPVILR